MPAREEDRPDSSGSSLDAVRGRYAQPPLQRWSNLVFAVLWLTAGVGQVVRDSWPFGLVVGVAYGCLAAATWLIPAARISDDGIRLGRKTLIAWSQISDVSVPADNGWKPPPAELVLLDGRREPLPMLSRPQSVKLREHALRHGTGTDRGTLQE